MGAIKERLRMAKENQIRGGIWTFEYAGEAIESELNDLVERVNKELKGRDSKIRGLEKDILDLFKMLAQRTKRIEALEDCAHTPSEKELKDPVPTDKDGKPPGGLESGDVISYKNRDGKVFGIFTYIEGNTIYADWMHPLKPCPHINFVATVQKEEITFEFRPRLPDRKER